MTVADRRVVPFPGSRSGAGRLRSGGLVVRRDLAGELAGDASDRVVEARVLVGAPVGHERLEGLARRVDQALGHDLAGVGDVVVVDEPAFVEHVDLLVDPGGVDGAVLGDRAGVVEVDPLVCLDEQPGGPRRKVDTGCVDGALDERLRALAADQAGELASQLAQRVAARRRGEGLANARRLDGLAQRAFLDQPREQEGDRQDRGGDEKDGRERVAERAGVSVADRRGQALDGRGVRVAPTDACGGSTGELGGETGGEDRTERGGAERAAHGAKEARARGRDPEIGVVDCVLHREHEHLHHQSEPEAQHEHRGVAVQRRRAGIELGQQQHPDQRDRGAGDREHLVAAGGRDRRSRADRADQHTRHHRDQLQP